MSMPGEYKAGTAYLSLKPKLADAFRAQVKTLIKPIQESITVTLKPTLAKGFNADVKRLAKEAAEKTGATDITFRPKLAKGFTTDLKADAKKAAEQAGQSVEFRHKLAKGFATSLKKDAKAAAEKAGADIVFGHKLAPKFRSTLKASAALEAEKVTGKVKFAPTLAPGFTTALRGKVNAAAAGVEATVTMKLSEAGLRQKIRALKDSLPAAELRVQLDFSDAHAQLAVFRATVAAQPLTMNVNIDSAAAIAQLMALRHLAGSVGDRISGTRSAVRSAARAAGTTVRGNIFTRPFRAVRADRENRRADVDSAVADRATATNELSRAYQQQTDAVNRLTEARTRHNELMSREATSESQRLSAGQALQRALSSQLSATNALREAEDNYNRTLANSGSTADDRAAAAARVTRAQNDLSTANDRASLAEARHREMMSRTASTESERVASQNRLTRASRDAADASSAVSRALGREAESHRNVDRSRSRQNSIVASMSAAWQGFRSAAVDSLQSVASNLFSMSTLAGVAKVALIALAAVSLVPLIGQVVQAAGVIALIPAAVAGLAGVLATVITGVSGIGDAFTAYSKVEDNAAKDAEAHAKAVESAQKSAASAARSVTSAQRGVASAEKGVRDAQKESLAAQKALTEARKDARKELEDLNRELGRTKLDEQGAAISVAEAKEELDKTLKDSTSTATERARAQYNYEKALQDQEDTIRNSKELAEKAIEANQKGVEGADGVVAAQERVAAAAEAEVTAQEALVDAQQSLADANANLADAQKELARAMSDTSDSVEDFERALGKLSPAAREFVQTWIDKVKPTLKQIKQDVQEALFGNNLDDKVANFVNGWSSTLSTGMSKVATAIREGVIRAMQLFDDEGRKNTVAQIFDNIAKSIGPVIDGIADLVAGMLALAGVGSNWMPSGAQSFADTMQKFREWAESPEGQASFKDFIQDSLDTARKLWNILKKVGSLIWSIFRGSDDVGESWLDKLVNKLTEWSDWAKSPEGQQKIKDFFTEVKTTVEAIVNGIDKAIRFWNQLTGDIKDSPIGKVLGGMFTDKKTLTDENGNPILDENGDPVEVEKSLTDKAKEIAGGILSGGWNYSPFVILSKAAYAVGTDIGEWLGEKIGKGVIKAAGWLAELNFSLEVTAGKFQDWLGDKASGVLDAFKDKFPGLSAAISAFTDDGQLSLKDMTEKGIGYLADLAGVNGFEKFKERAGQLKDFFGTLVDDIGLQIAKLPSKFAGPINMVIDKLNGFGDIWNKVADKLGLPKWEPLDHVAETQSGAEKSPKSATPIPGRWRGGPGGSNFSGQVTGPGGPKEDKAGLYRLSAGEHVWTADEVAAAGGHEAMYGMRKAALASGGKQSKQHGDGAPGYADGGIVSTSDPLDPIQSQLWDLVRSAIPGAILTSGKRFADVGSGYDYHMQGKAIDLAGPMDEIARWIYTTYPQSSELIHWPLNGWQNLKYEPAVPKTGRPIRDGATVSNEPLPFDPIHKTVTEVVAYLRDAPADEVDRVLAIERHLGANRRGITKRYEEAGL